MPLLDESATFKHYWVDTQKYPHNVNIDTALRVESKQTLRVETKDFLLQHEFHTLDGDLNETLGGAAKKSDKRIA